MKYVSPAVTIGARRDPWYVLGSAVAQLPLSSLHPTSGPVAQLARRRIDDGVEVGAVRAARLDAARPEAVGVQR